jgi:hypothetical protein
MKLTKIINEILLEHLNDNDIQLIIKRIPFLKNFKLVQRKTEGDFKNYILQNISLNNNHKLNMGDDIIVEFSQYTVVIEFVYYKKIIDPYVFHNFILRTEIYFNKPKHMDDLTFRILILANKQQQTHLSYNKEIKIEKNEPFSNDTLNIIINEINRKFFEIESFGEKNHLKVI